MKTIITTEIVLDKGESLLVLEAPVFRNFVKAEQRQRESGIITPGGNGKGRFKA